MELIAQPLSMIGLVFFGEAWRAPMAEVLEVDEDQVIAWENDPSSLPTGIEDKLTTVGAGRIGEIQLILHLLKEAGVDRENSDYD